MVLASIVFRSSIRGDHQLERDSPGKVEKEDAQSACRGTAAVLGGQVEDEKSDFLYKIFFFLGVG